MKGRDHFGNLHIDEGYNIKMDFYDVKFLTGVVCLWVKESFVSFGQSSFFCLSKLSVSDMGYVSIFRYNGPSSFLRPSATAKSLDRMTETSDSPKRRVSNKEGGGQCHICRKTPLLQVLRLC